MEYTAQELYHLLNDSDECRFIEAKTASDKSRSILETVCAFANEPNAGGGYLLLGVSAGKNPNTQKYVVTGIENTDKMQLDLSSQCNTIFNKPVRVEMQVEKLEDKNVIVLFVPELSHKEKPLFFVKDGFPKGSYRRIGSSDVVCTDTDIPVFYSDERTYEKSTIKGSTFEDRDEKAIEMYRRLRARVNPAAEELTYSDNDLLVALSCVNPKNKEELNLTGLLLFGSSKAQRKFLPMFRADYIRIPGNSWIESAEIRFRTIDMRGSIFSLVFRLVDAVNADLPKGFMLSEGELQAESVGLPIAALREAIINSLMHGSFREQRPIQIRRYDNRIEIENAGYSLKPTDELGQPGSIPRNPALAQILHDTNLAETKGSGIRAMRRLMKAAHLAPPTFESNRSGNTFTTILLLHNFLNPDDLKWLARFGDLNLNDAQKMALIFIRELGAIDNTTYRQFGDCDTLHASADLRKLKDQGLLEGKRGGRSTYYVATKALLNTYGEPVIMDGKPVNPYAEAVNPYGESVNPYAGSVNPYGETVNPYGDRVDLTTNSSISSTPRTYENLLAELPEDIKEKVLDLKKRELDQTKIFQIIENLCLIRAYRLVDLSTLLKRKQDTLAEYLKVLLDDEIIGYRFPEMIRHPEQAYLTLKKDNK